MEKWQDRIHMVKSQRKRLKSDAIIYIFNIDAKICFILWGGVMRVKDFVRYFLFAGILFLAILSMTCIEINGSDDDITPPARVTDLQVDSVAYNAVYLSWTAPGDNNATGMTYAYEMRYSSKSIKILDWNEATIVMDLDYPLTPGSKEQHEIRGLLPDTEYFFALKTLDRKGNTSQISNIAPYEDIEISFPDSDFEKAIRFLMVKDTGIIRYSDALCYDRLTITFNNIIADLTGLEYFKNLRQFLLYGSNVSDIAPLSQLAELQNLIITPSHIDEICPLENLVNIEYIDFTYNRISDLSGFSGLNSLKKLILNINEIEDLTPLAGLISLNSLSLDENEISNLSPLTNLKCLKGLNLKNNLISDISPLEELDSLISLDISGNQLTDLNALFELESLKILYAVDNHIEALDGISELTNLERLCLVNNQISDLSPLAGLANLERLTVSKNYLTNLNGIQNHPSLEVIDLTYNEIEDVSGLSGLPSLDEFYLQYNRISNLAAFADLENISRLALYDNLIEDIHPLVINTNIGEGDIISLRENPLSEKSINEYIPILQSRGVTVIY
jgi:Leucine-rich repeat (LRR) protein